jgi:hypothetical protein
VIRNTPPQPQSQKPAVSRIDLNLFFQPSLRADSEEVSDQQHLKEHHRVNRRAAVVRAVQMFDLLVDKREVDHLVDLAQQMVPRDKGFDADELELRLLSRLAFEHEDIRKKPPRFRESFINSLYLTQWSGCLFAVV